MMKLSAAESRRYARHIVLKGVGGPGQQRLKAARVLVVGAGGLGSPVIAYLAAAGVGTIGIVDDDVIALSNLQRQIVHRTDDVGDDKAHSAAQFARSLNPEITVDEHRVHLSADNGLKLIDHYELILDCTDNFAARQVISDAAQRAGRVLISGGVSLYDGHVTVIAPHLADAHGDPNPRFSDLFPDAPEAGALPNCAETGIIGAVTGVIGTLMAMEAIKIITWIGEPLIGRLLIYDGQAAKFSEVTYKRRH